MIETFGTGRVPDEVIEELIHRHFDLRPGAIIRDLKLRRPIYKQTATYGHFGRHDLDLPWEQTDKAEILRREAGLSSDIKLEILVPDASDGGNGRRPRADSTVASAHASTTSTPTPTSTSISTDSGGKRRPGA